MSKILVEFDTESKECSFIQDGNKVSDVFSVGVYGYRESNKKDSKVNYSMEMTRYEFFDDKTITTRLLANKEEYEKPETEKMSDLKDFVVVKDEVSKDIAAFLSRKSK